MSETKLLNNKLDIVRILKNNTVVMLFATIAIAGAVVSALPVHFIFSELIGRISRNAFLVLSLIIPILAGVGLNFGIVIGAIAGQIGLIVITYHGLDGGLGMTGAVFIATPIAIFLGILTGILFNKTKGQEMIAGLIVGFFAKGIYEFIFLFLVGTAIPVDPQVAMVKPDGIGLRNTISLGSTHGEGIKYTIDYILRMNIWHMIIVAALVFVGINIFFFIKRNKKQALPVAIIAGVIAVAAAVVAFAPIPALAMTAKLKAPLATWLLVAGLCFFNILIMRTKLGQDIKAVGRSQHISGVAGINVDKTRLIAVVISTVLAAWGQIIFLQNIGTMNTYGSHMQVGLFAVAAILVGGATVTKANISHAIIGTILLHAIFVVSPNAGKNLFGDAQIGEFFRAAVAYGVIAVALVLHAWKAAMAKKHAEEAADLEDAIKAEAELEES